MIPLLLATFPPMLLGAQLVLNLILVKGDICPGQRGRLHKLIPALSVLWLAVVSIKLEAFLIVAALMYFFTQVQTKKTRDAGPLWVIYLANGLSVAFVAIQISQQPSLAASAISFVSIFLSGAVFSHLLLTVARSRLQAFHRILPFTGIVSAMVTALLLVALVYGLTPEQLESMTMPIVTTLVVMITGIVVWSWHIIRASKANKVQLSAALVVMLLAGIQIQALYPMIG